MSPNTIPSKSIDSRILLGFCFQITKTLLQVMQIVLFLLYYSVYYIIILCCDDSRADLLARQARKKAGRDHRQAGATFTALKKAQSRASRTAQQQSRKRICLLHPPSTLYYPLGPLSLLSQTGKSSHLHDLRVGIFLTLTIAGTMETSGSQFHASQHQQTTAVGTPALPGVGTSNNHLQASVIETLDGISGGILHIHIQNITSTAKLGVQLDLKKIALKCRNTEFNPRRYGAVVMKVREFQATAIIFASGKIVITGTKNTDAALGACEKVSHIIKLIGFTPKPNIDFKLENMVGTFDCGFPIKLESLEYAHSTFASYEPELFPGLVFRFVKPARVVALIFVSGKVIIKGAKKFEDLSKALTKLYPILVEFRKVHVAPSLSAPVTPQPGLVPTVQPREGA